MLIPEIKAIVGDHMRCGLGPSPESTLIQTLYLPGDVDVMTTPHVKPDKQETMVLTPEPLPIVQWLLETAKPRMGLHALRRRLAKKLSGTMAQTVREGRDDRV